MLLSLGLKYTPRGKPVLNYLIKVIGELEIPGCFGYPVIQLFLYSRPISSPSLFT
jgi:hypothetical protein